MICTSDILPSTYTCLNHFLDLDALDENVPLTKFTLDELMGRVHSVEEYNYYFTHNKHGKKFRGMQERFATEHVHASAIVPRKQKKKDGCSIM